MRILLLGNTGQLGWELERTLISLGEVTALDYPTIDLAKPDSLRSVVREARPQVIVNATGYTAVDRAESEMPLAEALNAVAPGILAEEALRLGAALIHYSTDYVFDGEKGIPYVEADTPNPLSAYARSKLAGEQAIQQASNAYLILRTAWMYTLRRESFVTKVLQWAREQRVMRVVEDQVSNPTWARLLAEVTAQVLAMGGKNVVDWLAEHRGLYHLAGDGHTSRYEWAQAILRLDPRREEQVVVQVLPALTVDFPTLARRPLFSALNCGKFTEVFGRCLPPWEAALRLAMGI
jgi:dTDP-4-dehydrorhamnose reductase